MKVETYQSGTQWQLKVYSHLADYLTDIGITEFGKSTRGSSYKHLLNEKDKKHNFINKRLYDLTLARFSQHKAGDLNRILTNTASSQVYCFNLMLHLNENKELANALFSELFQKMVVIHHIEPEFTPNKMYRLAGFENEGKDETIGDQTEIWGTDAVIEKFSRYVEKEPK